MLSRESGDQQVSRGCMPLGLLYIVGQVLGDRILSMVFPSDLRLDGVPHDYYQGAYFPKGRFAKKVIQEAVAHEAIVRGDGKNQEVVFYNNTRPPMPLEEYRGGLTALLIDFSAKQKVFIEQSRKWSEEPPQYFMQDGLELGAAIAEEADVKISPLMRRHDCPGCWEFYQTKTVAFSHSARPPESLDDYLNTLISMGEEEYFGDHPAAREEWEKGVLAGLEDRGALEGKIDEADDWSWA